MKLMRYGNKGAEKPALLEQRGLDPRNQKAAIGLVIGMLELAAAALRKVAARWILMVRGS